MSDFSTYSEQLTLDWMFNLGTPTRPTAWYIQLHTAAPTDAGTSNVSTTIADRTQYSGGWTRSAETVDNDAAWESSAATGGETITHCSIWDAVSAGNCLYVGDCTDVTVASGVKVRFAAGTLDVSHE